MPDRIQLPNAPDDVNRTLGRLSDELDAKQPRNLLRASYYDGKRAVRQVGTIIPIAETSLVSASISPPSGASMW